MKNKRIKFIVFLLLLIATTRIRAQEVVPASGGNASGTGGSSSYTVGQVFYSTSFGTNGSVAEGVQQPFEISVITEIKDAQNINLECNVYPNPVTELLKLNINGYNNQNLYYQLYDIKGKLIENKKITENEISISMNNLVHSTYFLKIIQNHEEIKVFKIIKN